MRRLVLAFIAVCWTAMAVHAEQVEHRVALVIGDADYQHVDRLANPGNDARLIADTLKKSGFALVGGGAQLDLDKAAIRSRWCRRSASRSRAPTWRCSITPATGCRWTIPTGWCRWMPTRRAAGPGLPDGQRRACAEADGRRGNPAEHPDPRRLSQQSVRQLGTRAVGSGLAQMRAPDGTMISFATQPGTSRLMAQARMAPTQPRCRRQSANLVWIFSTCSTRSGCR